MKPPQIKRNQVITFQLLKRKGQRVSFHGNEVLFTSLVFSTEEREDPLANQAKGKLSRGQLIRVKICTCARRLFT